MNISKRLKQKVYNKKRVIGETVATMQMAIENDAILEFKCVSNSNITNIEGMKSCDEQTTLSMKQCL